MDDDENDEGADDNEGDEEYNDGDEDDLEEPRKVRRTGEKISVSSNSRTR